MKVKSNYADHSYDDIINLPHPTSAKYPRMPVENRAVQFAPFAALTGHEAAIRETARLTDTRPELDEYEKETIDRALRCLMQNPGKLCAEFTCFVPDSRKEGGSFAVITGSVKKMNDITRILTLTDGRNIPVDDIMKIEIKGDIVP